MDIAILNYPTGEVDILRDVDYDSIKEEFEDYEDDVECYLENLGYDIHDIHYMCSETLVINDN